MTASIAQPLGVDGPDVETLLELSRLTDPVAVLSVYVDARPGALRTSSIDIKNRITELERRIADDGSQERSRAVREGIARLEGEIDRLTDPDEPGRGRILFAAMTDRWLRRASTQLPPPNRVVLNHGPFIHPLLELLDEGTPAGVLLASRTEARLLEWRLGEHIPLQEMQAEVAEPRHERSGPVGSRPASRYGTPTGEQRNARDRDLAARFFERVAAAASRLAHERGWDRILVSAGEQHTDSLVAALPPALRATALRDHRLLLRLDPAIVEAIVTDRVRAAHAEFETRLIGRVREQAHGAGAVALGLSEVVGALNQARVSHLVYDPFVRYRGSIAADGTLYAEDEAALSSAATADPRLTERIVERALETGARVSPVEGAAAGGLAEADGIAAVLRW
jgi:hypothetical protein